MKNSVTAWHRGIVATEDEIRKKRHNKCRIFSCSLILLFSCAAGARAEKINPMFGAGNINRMALHFGGLFDFGKAPDMILPLGAQSIEYSQPSELLRFPARFNVLVQHRNGDNKGYWMYGASWDAALIHTDNFYVGGGLGFGERDRKFPDTSKFQFIQRFVLGYRFDSDFGVELLVQHASNGGLTEGNRGFDWMGIGATYAF